MTLELTMDRNGNKLVPSTLDCAADEQSPRDRLKAGETMDYDGMRRQRVPTPSGGRRDVREAQAGPLHATVHAQRIVQMQSAVGNRATGRWLAGAARLSNAGTIQRNGDDPPFQKEDTKGRVWSLDDATKKYYITAANERRVYEEEFQALTELVEAAKRWNDYSPALGGRVNRAVAPLPDLLASGKVAFTDSIFGILNNVNKPLKENKADRADKQKDASEALSELDLVADVLSSKEVSGALELGAKGPQTHGTGEVKHAEEKHGKLPPLGVDDLEVDAYYRTSDDILHIDEVKDTPQALGDKAKTGEQIARQVQWLKREVFGPYDPMEDEQEPIKKEVGYMMRAAEPRFDKVLSQDVISNLKLIEAAQWRRGLPFLNMAGRPMTVAQLQKMYDDAIQWLQASKDVYTRMGMKQSDAISRYFSNFETARTTLQQGPLT